MLLIPFFIGVGIAGNFGPESALFLLCILSVFMATEPLNAIIRSRRVRTKRKNPSVTAAFRWFFVYLTVACLVSIPLLLLYQRWWLLFFGALGAAFLGAQGVIKGYKLDRTRLGELVGALGLSLSSPGVYYVATGELGLTAFLLWFLNALHSASSVFYINMRLRHRRAKYHRRGAIDRISLGLDTLAYLVVLLAVLIGLGFLGLLPLLALVSFIPLACKIVKSIYEARPEFNFRRLGLVELANSVVFAALLILSFAVG